MQFYDSDSDEPRYFAWDDVTHCLLFPNCSDIVYIVHGYSEKINLSSPYYNDMRIGYQSHGYCVILVDWYKGEWLTAQLAV